MNFLFFVQVFLVVAMWLLVRSSPVPEGAEDSSEAPVFVLSENVGLPVADQIEDDKDIKTNVIGKMEDLEVTTWISHLSELNFTFPPDMADSLRLQDYEE